MCILAFATISKEGEDCNKIADIFSTSYFLFAITSSIYAISIPTYRSRYRAYNRFEFEHVKIYWLLTWHVRYAAEV
jgi:hypothetical protein